MSSVDSILQDPDRLCGANGCVDAGLWLTLKNDPVRSNGMLIQADIGRANNDHYADMKKKMDSGVYEAEYTKCDPHS